MEQMLLDYMLVDILCYDWFVNECTVIDGYSNGVEMVKCNIWGRNCPAIYQVHMTRVEVTMDSFSVTHSDELHLTYCV